MIDDMRQNELKMREKDEDRIKKMDNQLKILKDKLDKN